MNRTLGTTAALVAITGLLYAGTNTADAGDSARRATAFAFKASGYGTKASGGLVPANSDPSAFQALGCTNHAGIDKDNFVAVEELPGAGRAEEVTTRLRTTAGNGTAASTSTSHIARVVLEDASAGALEITGISSRSRAFFDNVMQATTRTTVGALTLTPPAGPPQSLPVPTPGQPVEVPGLATISVGTSLTREGTNSALARAEGVKIDFAPTQTTLRIGRSSAIIERGVKSGLFRGNSSAARAQALDEDLQLGQTPLLLMPCRGTDGELRTRSTARLTLGPGVTLRNISARQLGEQTRSQASGFELGRVGTLELGDADVLVNNIIGKANAVLTSAGTTRSARGTSVGSVTVQGEQRKFPDSDVLEIPGVAKLERSIIRRSDTGIHVIALRVTLLDGSGAVLNLGEADFGLRRATQ